jgi:hypothetical protein
MAWSREYIFTGAGISVPSGAKLTIGGDGSLRAKGGFNGAGIGSSAGAAGDITITGGTIAAIGGPEGPEGWYRRFVTDIGSVTLSSGVILSSRSGKITVTGGTVIANRIGKDEWGYPYSNGHSFDTLKMSGNGVVFANEIADKDVSRRTGGILFIGDTGHFYGKTVTPTNDFSISGRTLTIPDGATLAINEGVTVRVTKERKTLERGKVQADGSWYLKDGWEISTSKTSLTNSGTIANSGTIITCDPIGGQITGTGKVVTDCAQAAPEELFESYGDFAIPVAPPDAVAVVLPPPDNSGAGADGNRPALVAGPNPVSRGAGSIAFFRQGKAASGTLTIYDAAGNVIRKITIKDNAIVGADGNRPDRRVVAEWDLKDAKGRLVPEGTYLARGVVRGADGKRERVSVVLGVR